MAKGTLIRRAAPKTLEEACELVRSARDAGETIVPVGAGTKRDWTAEPEPPFTELDMRGLDRVVEYSPEDMTITVEAGMTLGRLAAKLSDHNQRLTLDPPNGDRATIGGVLGANDSGPIRFAYGTARDVVIGMSMIEPDGVLIRSGGKVVKNVAGYDLHKLYIGSFGALGPIATVTFRLRPLPEARGLVVLQPREADDAERMIADVLAGETRPTLIDLLNARAARSLELESRLALIVGFEENADAVRWQCERLMQTVGGTALGEGDSEALYGRLCEAAGAEAECSFKATMLSSEVASFIALAETVIDSPGRLVARAGSGIVYGLLDAPLKPVAWHELNAALSASRGGLHLRGAIQGEIPRFGRPRPDAMLSEAIRQAIDPVGLFAPDRVS